MPRKELNESIHDMRRISATDFTILKTPSGISSKHTDEQPIPKTKIVAFHRPVIFLLTRFIFESTRPLYDEIGASSDSSSICSQSLHMWGPVSIYVCTCLNSPVKSSKITRIAPVKLQNWLSSSFNSQYLSDISVQKHSWLETWRHRGYVLGIISSSLSSRHVTFCKSLYRNQVYLIRLISQLLCTVSSACHTLQATKSPAVRGGRPGKTFLIDLNERSICPAH